jgi:hypothetical protein
LIKLKLKKISFLINIFDNVKLHNEWILSDRFITFNDKPKNNHINNSTTSTISSLTNENVEIKKSKKISLISNSNPKTDVMKDLKKLTTNKEFVIEDSETNFKKILSL